jgi:co-chaperonin GroES (HSP10)
LNFDFGSLETVFSDIVSSRFSMSTFSTSATRVKAQGFRPYKGKVFVTDIERGETVTKSGIIITDDNMTNRGIRARWARVWAVGDDVEDIKVGEWILVEHGRWTNRITIELDGEEVDLWRVDWPDAVLVASDERPDATAASDPKKEFGITKKTW